MAEQEENWLLDDSNDEPISALPIMAPWRILIVDDEPDIHTVTKLAISNIVFKNRTLEFLSAYSAHEGLMVMRKEKDIALVLLDVVMETDDAGLLMAKQIREELQNSLVRIVLRTGQPGHAPERDVILNYDINDYKAKTELSSQKLFTTIISSLRTYESLMMIERSRKGIERILDASSDLYHIRSLREFASSVLHQVSVVLDVGADGVLCLQKTIEDQEESPLILAATGQYANYDGVADDCVDPSLLEVATRAFLEKKSSFNHPLDVLYVATPVGHEFAILVSPPWPLAEEQRKLLELFCAKIALSFDNLYAFDQLKQLQNNIVGDIDELLHSLIEKKPDHIKPILYSLISRLELQTKHHHDLQQLEKFFFKAIQPDQ